MQITGQHPPPPPVNISEVIRKFYNRDPEYWLVTMMQFSPERKITNFSLLNVWGPYRSNGPPTPRDLQEPYTRHTALLLAFMDIPMIFIKILKVYFVLFPTDSIWSLVHKQAHGQSTDNVIAL